MFRIKYFLIVIATLAALPCGTFAQGQIHKAFTVSGDASIVIVNPRGAIKISASAENKAEVDIVSKGGPLDENSVSLEQTGKRLVIDTSRSAAGSRVAQRGQLSVEVKLPGSVNLDSIVTVSGDITIDGAGSRVNARTTSGNIHLLSVPGDVKLGAISGNITVEKSGGLVSVASTSGRIVLRSVGSVIIEGRSDNVTVEDVKADANISTTSGSIQVTSIGGRLKASTLSGGITAKGIQGDARLSTLSEGISIEDVGGRVTATAISGDVTVSRIRNGIQASSVSGSIKVQGAAGPLEAQSTGGNIILGGVSSRDVKAACHSGNISFSGEIFDDGRYSFDSFSGSVSLDIPKDSSFSFSGRTLSGHISSEFPFRDDPHQADREGRRTLTGSYGRENAGRISASSFSGSIRLRMR